MPISLTQSLGKKRSRSIKKVGGYAIGVVVCFAGVCVLHTAITVWRLGKSLVNDTAYFAEWDAPYEVRVLLLVSLVWSPWLLWLIWRAWYKYTHWQQEVVEERERNQSLWDLLSDGRGAVLEKLESTKVRDRGNYRDDVGGQYTKRDMQNMARNSASLEDWENQG